MFWLKLPTLGLALHVPLLGVLEIPPTYAPLSVIGDGLDELQSKVFGPASTVIEEIICSTSISLKLVQPFKGLVIVNLK